MIATRPFILYTLPKSRTTQAFLQGNKIERIWENLASFLTNCTTTTINDATKITLSAYTAYKEDKHPDVADKILSDTLAIFGKGQTRSTGDGYPDEITWKIEQQDLFKAVGYLQKGQPWPKFSFGPVELLIIYDFKLIDPFTKKELPNQENTSDILIWLSKNCCCSTNFWFPFTEPTKDFTDYLYRIEKYLPFILERKYLKIGRPNKTRTAHILTKLIPETK
jgi:hypothetical protein